MFKIIVKNIMVPLSDYATVSDKATLLEAIRALENEKRRHGDRPYRHRAVLVLDEDGDVIGKISQVDIIAALEPNYREIGTGFGLDRLGFSASFISAMRKQYKLWERTVDELLETMRSIKVVDVMYTPADHQRVKETDTIDVAMHQIVMGRHQSLLVTRGRKIVGILRSTDVFNALWDIIEQSTQKGT